MACRKVYYVSGQFFAASNTNLIFLKSNWRLRINVNAEIKMFVRLSFGVTIGAGAYL